MSCRVIETESPGFRLVGVYESLDVRECSLIAQLQRGEVAAAVAGDRLTRRYIRAADTVDAA